MKKFLALILSLIGVVGIFISWQGISFLNTPASEDKQEVIVDISPGKSFYGVARDLESRGLITDLFKFKVLVKLFYSGTPIKVGEYKLTTNMRPLEVLNIITSGQSITYPLTIPEGHNIYEIREQLNVMWPGRGDEFFNLVKKSDFAKSILGIDVESLEGYLYPETYMLSRYTTMESLIRQMVQLFRKQQADFLSQAKVNMSLHEQVILASVIEKETGAAEERALISSVFHNRLKKKMRLQSDPTILYGILAETNELKSNITKADILRPTPYNTYTVPALPKGPIANPGREALIAAINPAESEYLYFVSRNDGTHVFTSTYKDHENAVKKFQLDRKMREGKSWRDRKEK